MLVLFYTNVCPIKERCIIQLATLPPPPPPRELVQICEVLAAECRLVHCQEVINAHHQTSESSNSVAEQSNNLIG